MLDPLIADTMLYIEEQHASIDFAREPKVICADFGIDYHVGPRNFAYRDEFGIDEIIVVDESQYNSEQLIFNVAHEICHILIRRGGYYKLIRHHHASVSNMKRHIELLTNHAAGRLMMPAPDLREARLLHGERPQAVLKLMELSGAGQLAAMLRWAEQDFDEHRGVFVADGPYITSMATCGLRLPFKKFDRVPEVILHRPEVSGFSLGGREIMGTVSW